MYGAIGEKGDMWNGPFEKLMERREWVIPEDRSRFVYEVR